MTRTLRALAPVLALLGASFYSNGAAATQTVCVFDPAGKSGFAYGWMVKWSEASAAWGSDVELKHYNDEETAVKDFDNGACAGLAATGPRLQKYNRSTYTIEAVAGIPSYTGLKNVLGTLQTRDTYAHLFTSGGYETAGIYPLGAVYAFVRDRNIDAITDFAGKDIAYMEYDKTSLTVVQTIGGNQVPVNLSTLSSTFNNGRADATFVPASAYTPFELWKGLGDSGAVVKYPLLQVTMQIVLRADAFPAGFGTQSRAFVAGSFGDAMSVIESSEGAIKSSYWIPMESPEKSIEFEREMQKLRIKLRDQGVYDPEVLTLLRQARCHEDSNRWECANPIE